MSKHNKMRREFWRTTHLFIENAVTNNIVLIQALGLCPIIAISTTLQNGVAMAACTAAVMLPLSLMTALLSNSLPKWLRPAVYVILAALILVGCSFVLERYISTELNLVNCPSQYSLTLPVSPCLFFATIHSAIFFSSVSGL